MRKPGETIDLINALKISGTIGMASLAVGGCEAIAEKLAGSPPDKPKQVTAVRDPIQLQVGFDESLSDIKNKLGDAVRATEELLQDDTVLNEGDKVNLCEIGGKGEGAICRSYELNKDRPDLLKNLADLKAQYRDTLLEPAFRTMVAAAGNKKNTITFAWTDGKDETPKDQQKGPIQSNNPFYVTIPSPSYRPFAEAVNQKITGPDHKVVEATNGVDLKKLVETTTNRLKDKAQTEAQAKADIEYKKAINEYNQKLTAREKVLKTMRNWTIGISVTVVGALTALATALTLYRRRPLVRGCLVKIIGGRDKVLYLSGKKKTLQLSEINARWGQGEFMATSQGTHFNGQLLENGQEIADGLYYFKTQPDRRTIQNLIKGVKK